MFKKVQKRNGDIVPFDSEKIRLAIEKAAKAVEVSLDSSTIVSEVLKRLSEKVKNKIPQVEVIQDLVEEVLMSLNYTTVARAYITYREKRAETRRVKKFLGVEDDLKLSVNAIVVLQKRYLLKDDKGNVIETPGELFRRVARSIADVDRRYNDPDGDEVEEKYFEMMKSKDFMPNSPTLMNAGTPSGQLSACFVVPVKDSLEGIFDAVKAMAIIQKSGGGTGFSFSKLRPSGDIVQSTKGIASGPVSFMRIFDITTDVIKQGGKRRGANMGILRCDHPDIFEFITAKREEGQFTNFNLSVAATDNFMEAVSSGRAIDLINPRTGLRVRTVKARDIFDLIVTTAWKTGDPGLVFIDEVNRHNPTPHVGEIESTNPCGEQPLLPWESCNLGSINISRFVKNGEIDWKRLREIIKLSVRFLDNVIDANVYPLPEIEKITLENRKIGLGIMGLAEMFIKMGVPYDSGKSLKIADKLAKFLTEEARKESAEIARKRGAFPNFKGSLWDKKGYPPLRNSTVTTIAPTGTISIIAGTSSGIEPLFAIAFTRNVLEGTKLLEVNQLFEEIAIKENFYSQDLMMEIARTGTIKNNKHIPERIRKIFRTAFDIEPSFHVRIQAVFQQHVDNGVSKTVNLHSNASQDDVRNIFLLAYKLKCKGITVYRYGSKKKQVLKIAESPDELKHISAEVEYAGGCPIDTCPF